MTVKQKDYLKQNWLTFANFLILLTLAYNVGVSATELRKDVDTNKVNLIEHRQDLNVHMPFEEKIKVFVPRTEIEQMQGDISEIKKDIKELLKAQK